MDEINYINILKTTAQIKGYIINKNKSIVFCLIFLTILGFWDFGV